MSNLAIVESKEITLDSRDVAEMVGKNHNDLLKDIRQYEIYLTEGNFPRSVFFQESQYKDKSGKQNPCYFITRKGCEFIANKLTGQKGTVFTASYINKFHEMEKQQPTPKLPIDKNKRLEIQERNARAKIANLYLRIADNDALPTNYRGIFLSYASKELSGQDILPLPETGGKTYTATDISEETGIHPNTIGKIATANGLKTAKYGLEVWDKAKNHSKQVPSWRYNEAGRAKLKEILQNK